MERISFGWLHRGVLAPSHQLGLARWAHHHEVPTTVPYAARLDDIHICMVSVRPQTLVAQSTVSRVKTATVRATSTRCVGRTRSASGSQMSASRAEGSIQSTDVANEHASTEGAMVWLARTVERSLHAMHYVESTMCGRARHIHEGLNDGNQAPKIQEGREYGNYA